MVARTNPMAIMCLNFVVSQTVLIVFVLVVSLLIVYLPSRFKQELFATVSELWPSVQPEGLTAE